MRICNAGCATKKPAPEARGGARSPQCLTDALARLVAQEQVVAACPRCQRSGMLRRTSFRALPPVVVVHVKRFRSGRKLSEPLRFPVDSLDMRPFLSQSTPSAAAAAAAAAAAEAVTSGGGGSAGHRAARHPLGLYELFAAIEHKGASSAAGHYVTYIASRSPHAVPPLWHRCNDTRVEQVRLPHACHCTGHAARRPP